MSVISKSIILHFTRSKADEREGERYRGSSLRCSWTFPHTHIQALCISTFDVTTSHEYARNDIFAAYFVTHARMLLPSFIVYHLVRVVHIKVTCQKSVTVTAVY